MAFPPSLPIADQFVLPMDGVQGFFHNKRVDENFQFFKIFSSFDSHAAPFFMTGQSG